MESTHGKNQTANKWLNDTSSTVMEMCNKQANLVFDFYNNFFNSMPGMSKNNWMSNMNFAQPHDGYEISNPFFSASKLFKTNSFMDLCASQYQDMYKQITDYNNLWGSMFQKKSQNTQENWSASAEKIQAIVEKEWKIRNDMASTLLDTYNKQMDASIELNRKFMEELNNQFNAAFKRNEKFCSDIFKGTHTAAAHKEEKEHEPIAAKKHKAEPAHAHNHNHNHHKH